MHLWEVPVAGDPVAVVDSGQLLIGATANTVLRLLFSRFGVA